MMAWAESASEGKRSPAAIWNLKVFETGIFDAEMMQGSFRTSQQRSNCRFKELDGSRGDGCSPVGQCRKCSLSPARATVGGDVLVHLDNHDDNYEGNEDDEDAYRPGEIR